MATFDSNKHLSIWTPRPDALVKELISPCITMYGLPAITITRLPITSQQRQALQLADACIFISHNSVSHLLNQLAPSAINSFLEKKIIAIGDKTAVTLQNNGLRVDVIATAPHSSETLLAMPDFNQLQYQQITIISGEGGRSLLHNTLVEQQKKVDLIHCYRRDKCDLSVKTMIKFIEEYSITGVIVTSCHIADVVHAAFSKLNTGVFDYPMFALSQRIGDYLSSLGFTKVIVAQKATQQSLNQTIITWWDSR